MNPFSRLRYGVIVLLTCTQGSPVLGVLQEASVPRLFIPAATLAHVAPVQATASFARETPLIEDPTAKTPETSGVIITKLETEGRPSIIPFPTPKITKVVIDLSIKAVASTFQTRPRTASPSVKLAVMAAADHDSEANSNEKRGYTDCFQPMATNSFPSQFPTRSDHPAPRIGIPAQEQRIPTNKFYANFFLGSQGQGVWTHPYSLTWSKGGGNLKSWGMAISHIDANQKAYGAPNTKIPGSPVQYYINPIGIQSIILSAIELGPNTVLTTDNLKPFSANANLLPQSSSSSSIKFPLVQGMGFVTAVYKNLMPVVQSSVFFRSFTQVKKPRAGVYKYRLVLEDGKTWLLYATSTDGSDPSLQLVSTTQIQGTRGWNGIFQVGKNPIGPTGEIIYDYSAGVYAASATISASLTGNAGTYSISWQKGGVSPGPPLLMHALPHHMQSMDASTKGHKTPLRLQTTVKGLTTAILANSWTLHESNLPIDMTFAPFSPSQGPRTALSNAAKAAIKQIAVSEISQDMNAQSNLDSMYFSGKALSKFAVICYTLNDLLGEKALASQGLQKLKTAFATFVNNKQMYPLVYDSKWGGLVSSGSYVTGQSGQDFGNTYYNDHHFHYGYFLHAAAIIGYLDPSWLNSNAAWVNSLVRDAASPSTTDPLFTFSRMFDWFNGHSFAKGLFESGDGKDEESSSEDAFFAYALKMWGKTSGDSSMEARGTLMMAVMTRSLNNYFLMSSDNVNQPSNFIANKVTGILFENKADHTTYFGANPEYIQGIHMIPLSPSSPYTRTSKFINEEWQAYFSDSSFNPASQVAGGWKGILYGNLACINPRAAFAFFSQTNFDPDWIDGGASRTWYLAYSAVMANL